jgi:hypothetical protein
MNRAWFGFLVVGVERLMYTKVYGGACADRLAPVDDGFGWDFVFFPCADD